MGKNAKTVIKAEKSENKKKNDVIGSVYRQFSRERYNRYKRQFPRMRESEVVAKIIKEWQGLGEEKKKEIQKRYTERMGKDFFKSGSSSLSKNKSSSKSKSKSKDGSVKKTYLAKSSQAIKKAQGEPTKKIKKRSPQTRVYNETKRKSPKRDLSDFKRSSSKEVKLYDSSEDASSMIAKMKEKKKKEKKEKKVKTGSTKNTAYLQFYKYYFDRLSSEHPRWNSTQITTIIKLLWKKRAKQNRKKGKPQKTPAIKLNKSISGWVYYRRTKEKEGLARDKIKEMWRSLPIESKRFYRMKGQEKIVKPKTSGSFVRRVLNAGVVHSGDATNNEIPQANYSWMNSNIK